MVKDQENSYMLAVAHMIFTSTLCFLAVYFETKKLVIFVTKGSIEMKELPMIGSFCLRKDFWDRLGANIDEGVA